MARPVKILAVLSLVLALAVTAWAGTWENVCHKLNLNPTHFHKPRVNLVKDIPDAWGMSFPWWHCILVGENSPDALEVLVHEYIHCALWEANDLRWNDEDYVWSLHPKITKQLREEGRGYAPEIAPLLDRKE